MGLGWGPWGLLACLSLTSVLTVLLPSLRSVDSVGPLGGKLCWLCARPSRSRCAMCGPVPPHAALFTGARTAAPPALRDPAPSARPFGKGPLSSASEEFPRVQPSFQGL